MKKHLLFFCALLVAPFIFAQKSSGLFIGISGDYGYQSQREAFIWNAEVEDFTPGIFTQLGIDLEWRTNTRFALQSGIKLARYQYTENSFGVPGISPEEHVVICIIGPLLEEEKQTERTFRALRIPLSINYHLEDVIPGRLHFALRAGLAGNVIQGRTDEELSRNYLNNIRPITFDGEIGTALYWQSKWGILTLGPVFRMALKNYGGYQPTEFLDKPNFRPYSFTLQAGYLWRL